MLAAVVSLALVSTTWGSEEDTAYLKKNAAKPGVVVLPSGLQYEVVSTADAAGRVRWAFSFAHEAL